MQVYKVVAAVVARYEVSWFFFFGFDDVVCFDDADGVVLAVAGGRWSSREESFRLLLCVAAEGGRGCLSWIGYGEGGGKAARYFESWNVVELFSNYFA
jgi:hypothetical protein